MPRLLPGAPTSTPFIPATGGASGACIVTGGLGALGLLIAAQQLAAGRGDGAHVVLLGRSVDLAVLDAGLCRVWQHAVCSAAPPQLTNSKCDASAATDVAGLADALHSSGVRIGAIMHAAGVLRVSGGSWGWLMDGRRTGSWQSKQQR